MELSATAPAPLTEMATMPPLTASEAATDSAWIDASSVAVTVIAPVLAVTSASAMKASTLLSMALFASETPTDSAMPAMPKAAANEAAAVSAWMVDVSCASRLTLVAEMIESVVSLPSMKADTPVVMRLSAAAPAPLKARPRYRPPATATEPAKTKASIDWSPVALTNNAPPAWTGVSSMYAFTFNGASFRLTIFQVSGSAKSCGIAVTLRHSFSLLY